MRFIKANNISTVIENLVSEWGKAPHEINNGECQEFADALMKRVGGEDASWPLESDLGGHVAVILEGLYYDAETPNGVRDPRDLKIFKNRFGKK